jgi:CheY-like chemotaxis protein
MRLLVVDDCAQTSETLGALLWLWGYEVRRAADGPSALEAASAFRPKVVLLDIALPGMDGFAVARALRTLPGEAGQVLVALTGYLPPGGPRQAWKAGFDHYLIKPIDPEELRELLHTIRTSPDYQPCPACSPQATCATPR